MPFEPKHREAQVHLNRLLVLADKISSGEAWIKRNFIVAKRQRFGGRDAGWVLVFPIFDPTDPLEVKIFTSGSLYGENFYNYADIRSKLFIMQDEVKEHTLLSEVIRSLRIHPQGPRYQHPHPEPEGEERDRLDLRRRWIAPDPFPDPRVHDQHGAPDGPEWLVSPFRLRGRR